LNAISTNEKICNFYPNSPKSITDNFKLVGCIKSFEENEEIPESVEIIVNYGFGGRITHTSKFSVELRNVISSQVVPRFWASKKIENLMLISETEQVKKWMFEIVREFNLVTPNTSLIVLETLDQFLKHKIEPPKILLEIYEEYHRLMNDEKLKEEIKHENKMLNVLDFWKMKVQWWNYHYSEVVWVPEVPHFMGNSMLNSLDNNNFENPSFWKELKEKERELVEKSLKYQEAQKNIIEENKRIKDEANEELIKEAIIKKETEINEKAAKIKAEQRKEEIKHKQKLEKAKQEFEKN